MKDIEKTFETWLIKTITQAVMATCDDFRFNKDQAAKFKKQFLENLSAITHLKKLKLLKGGQHG